MTTSQKTFLELTEQGDPGTFEAPEGMQKITLMNPRQLYQLWERQQWASQDIDFTRDIADWQAMPEREREIRLYPLSSFFLGEELVTTAFSAYVMSADNADEEAFLATQQVDEARHTQFFDRFYSEVVGFEQETLDERLAAAKEHVNDAFRQLFEEVLEPAVAALAADPRDRATKVRAITIYHMVIEGTLALTGQYTLTEGYTAFNLLPGFVEGFDHVARDEHRHVAYGTWFLQQAVEQDPAMEDVVLQTLAEALPHTAGVLVPPPQFDPDEIEKLGVITIAESHEYAYKALSRRMRAIGVSLDRLSTPA